MVGLTGLLYNQVFKLLSFALAGHTSSGALCVLGLLSQQTLELDR